MVGQHYCLARLRPLSETEFERCVACSHTNHVDPIWCLTKIEMDKLSIYWTQQNMDLIFLTQVKTTRAQKLKRILQ